MSEPLSPPEALEQLAPGVLLAGRYSLRERVPRWIAERRFRARDLETGDILTVLLWSSETPWFGELARRLTESPEPLCRDAGERQGFGLVALDWSDNLREPKGDADSADEALRLIRACQSAPKRSTPPPRKTSVPTTPEPPPKEPASRISLRPETPAREGNPLLEWLGFALAVAVGVTVIWFTFQLGRALSDPIVLEKETPVVAAPTSELGRQLGEVAVFVHAGNATAALQLLAKLKAEHPKESRIDTQIEALLGLLESDIPSIQAGFRPGMHECIDELAKTGHPAAVRFSARLESATNSSAPLPIR